MRRGRPEAVADATLRVDQRGAKRVELAPQVAHVRLEHLGLPRVLPAPHVLQELLAGEHEPLVAHQVGEQPELGRRQLDGGARPADRPGLLVQFQIAGPERARAVCPGAGSGAVGGALAGGATQDRADPGHERLDGERLGDVVVAAEGQPGDGVRRGVAGREEDDRDVVGLRAEPPAYLEAVDVGEHDVQDDQVGLIAGGALQRLLAARPGGHDAAMELEGYLDELADVPLVIDNEHLRDRFTFCHGPAPSCTLPRPYTGLRPPSGEYAGLAWKLPWPSCRVPESPNRGARLSAVTPMGPPRGRPGRARLCQPHG